MRKTKIICTIGPSSNNVETIKEMYKAGMNVCRLNFSHGDHEEQYSKIVNINAVRKELDAPIAIMLDTKGPEYRIGTFANKKVYVPDGATFTFTTDDIVGDETKVSVSYKNLTSELSVGDRVLVCNGLLIFEVKEIKGNDAICEMADKKSMSFPNKVLKADYLSEQDKKDLLFGIKNDVDFVAASFVSSKADMIAIRSFLDDNGGKDIDIIAKIENRAGVDNIEEICDIADGIMVARGDLGVEVPMEELPILVRELSQLPRCLSL